MNFLQTFTIGCVSLTNSQKTLLYILHVFYKFGAFKGSEIPIIIE